MDNKARKKAVNWSAITKRITALFMLVILTA